MRSGSVRCRPVSPTVVRICIVIQKESKTDRSPCPRTKNPPAPTIVSPASSATARATAFSFLCSGFQGIVAPC